MTHGTSSLRCPYCGQEFLSLQQRTDSPETCPHCSYSTILAEFLATAPATAPTAPAAPLLRRIIHSQPQPGPPPSMPGYSPQPSPFQNAPRPPSPFQQAAPSPTGLESLFTPPSKAAPPRPASPFVAVQSPPPRPAPAAAPPPAPVPAPRPAVPDLQFPEVPGLDPSPARRPEPPPPHRPSQPAFPQAPETLPPRSPSPPAQAPSAWSTPAPARSPFASPDSLPWPGLQKTGVPARGGSFVDAEFPPSHLDPAQSATPLPKPTPRPDRRITPRNPPLGATPLLPVRTVETESTPAEPVRESGLGPGGFLAALFIASVIGFAVWVQTQNQDAAWTFRFPSPAPGAAAPDSPPPAPPPPTPDDTEAIAAPTPEVAGEHGAPGTEEVRRAAPAPDEPPDLPPPSAPVPGPVDDLREAAAAVPDLVRRLFEANTPAERAACIAEPKRHSDDVESFFAATQGRTRPGFTSLQQFTAVPLTLPKSEPTVLFQIKTDANPGGALLRPIRQADGSWRIDWPLFQETHERQLENYLKTRDTEPRWFRVGLRPNHGFDVPEELRENHLVYDLQGSADNSIRVLALTEKNSALGRFLKREVEWGEIYLARVLLRWTQFTPDAEGLALIDCEGMNEANGSSP